MLSTLEVKIAVISIILFSYMVINAVLRKKMMEEIFTSKYRKEYFYRDHANKHSFIFVLFTVFMLLYYKKNKDKYEYGFDLFMLNLIEDYKHSNNYSFFDVEIEDEKYITDRIKKYERKNKLKKLNKKLCTGYMNR
jgi:hypothetical protein